MKRIRFSYVRDYISRNGECTFSCKDVVELDIADSIAELLRLEIKASETEYEELTTAQQCNAMGAKYELEQLIASIVAFQFNVEERSTCIDVYDMEVVK